MVFFIFSENSHPIDCSKEKAARADGRRLSSNYYVCPGGQGFECQRASSMLCDLKADCPGGEDEKEDICGRKQAKFLPAIPGLTILRVTVVPLLEEKFKIFRHKS